MSIEANKAVVRAYLTAVRERDEAALDAVMADDGAYWIVGMGDLNKAKMLRVVRWLWDSIEGPVTVTIDHLTAEEDRVSVIAHGDMATKAGGRYDNTYSMLAIIRDGRIHRWREYLDTNIATAALTPKAR